jgi:hypothetical protein
MFAPQTLVQAADRYNKSQSFAAPLSHKWANYTQRTEKSGTNIRAQIQ